MPCTTVINFCSKGKVMLLLSVGLLSSFALFYTHTIRTLLLLEKKTFKNVKKI